MRQIVVTILLAFGMSGSANAQTYLDKLQKNKQGEGTVHVTQSKAIDELVNGKPVAETTGTNTKPVTERPETVKKTGTDATQQTATPHKTEGNNAVAHQRKTDDTERASSEDTAPDLEKKVMRNSYKVTGYRVQVFAGGNSRADKQKANNIGVQMKTRFPNIPIYVHFYSPRWICRMGNFRTYQEAEKVMKEVKAMGYTGACVVKGKITVQY